MNSRFFILILTLLFLASCALWQTKKKPCIISGTISATKYSLAVPAHISFVVKENVVAEAFSDKYGIFNVSIPQKYINKKCQAIISPKKESVRIDTVIPKDHIASVELYCKADTFDFTVNTLSNLTIRLKNCSALYIFPDSPPKY